MKEYYKRLELKVKHEIKYQFYFLYGGVYSTRQSFNKEELFKNGV